MTVLFWFVEIIMIQAGYVTVAWCSKSVYLDLKLTSRVSTCKDGNAGAVTLIFVWTVCFNISLNEWIVYLLVIWSNGFIIEDWLLRTIKGWV